MTATPTTAYLICTDCRLGMLLGDTTATPDMTITAITDLHQTDDEPFPTVLAVWRLLNEHVGHTLRVLAECWYTFGLYIATPLHGIYPELPADRPASRVTDITADAYTYRWPYGRHGLPDYRGATPAPLHKALDHDRPAAAALVCLPCRITVDLGRTTVSPDGTCRPFNIEGRGASCFLADATAALIRLLVEHARHDLYIFRSDDHDYDDYFEAGDWMINVYSRVEDLSHRGDLTWQQYAAGWPDRPLYPTYLGMTPVGRLPCTSGGRLHKGCEHAPPPPRPDLRDIEPPVVAQRQSPAARTRLRRYLQAAVRGRQ